jgi:hypothetical protein
MVGKAKLNRVTVIQKIIDKKRAKTYLEIGVLAGDAFLRIKIKNKWGVDPHFIIEPLKKFRYYFKNPFNIINEYFTMDSDTFFTKEEARLVGCGVDVAFIDGLHTFSQSLKDAENALKYLNKNGVIVLHDCNPLSEAAAIPAASISEAQKLNPPGFTGVWNGDVWKTVAYLQATRQDLRVFVLDCDFGLGIITKGVPENMLNYSAEEVLNLSYHDLSKDRQSLLNLKDVTYFKEFLNGMKSNL